MTGRVEREKVLVLDALEVERGAIAQALHSLVDRGRSVATNDTLDGAALSRGDYGLVILDIDLLDEDWPAHLARLKKGCVETEFMLTARRGERSVEEAVEAMREGAYDYLVKPLDPTRLPVLAHKALEKRRLSEENRSLRERLSLKDEYGNVVGKSRSISAVYNVVAELRNVIERLTVTVEASIIRPEHLPVELDRTDASGRRISIRLGTPLTKVEEIVIRKTLEEVTDNRQKAARILGISPRALHYKIARYGVRRKRSPQPGGRP